MKESILIAMLPKEHNSIASQYYYVPELSIMMSYFITDRVGVSVSHNLLDLYLSCNICSFSSKGYASSWDLEIVVWGDKDTAKMLRHDPELMAMIHDSDFYSMRSTLSNNIDMNMKQVKGKNIGLVSISLEGFRTIKSEDKETFTVDDYEQIKSYIRTYGLFDNERYTRKLKQEEAQFIKTRVRGLLGYDPDIINKELNETLRRKDDKI